MRLAERLGYDGVSGALLLIPVVSMVVLVVWSLRLSPNEERLARVERELNRLRYAPAGPDHARA